MRLIQFEHPETGRRVGLIDSENVVDLTSNNEKWPSVYSIFLEARRSGQTISSYLANNSIQNTKVLPYAQLLMSHPGAEGGWILPPLDHPDPGHCLISGTGLTHLGSMEQRAQMHEVTTQSNADQKTDSQKMFEMGLTGGKPTAAQRGIQPEWFYKGGGTNLRGHNDFLEIPAFTEDGGEEPEIVGCYVVDDDGTPCRLGFAIGNEWADHRMERVNYLWLAPSKMRVCAVGPELVTDASFGDVHGECRIIRGDEEIYHSGELLTGEEHMSHTLANLEDHHFKYPQFRVPGDVHLHFFGTMKLSYPNREAFQTDDRVEIRFEGMGASLMNRVRRIPASDTPVKVERG